MKPTIIFGGTGSFAVPLLEAVHDIAHVALVISQPARPQGKKKELIDSPVATRAKQLGLPLQTPAKMADFIAEAKRIQPEVMVVSDYGRILPLELLAIPRQGVINAHPSLLPKHRGPTPVAASLLAGDEETGITIMRMDEQMDHGPIIAQERVTVPPNMTVLPLETLLADKAAVLLRSVLLPYLAGEIQPRAQDDSQATVHGLLKRDDGAISQNLTADAVWRRYRAYTPWPGIWLEADIKGHQRRVKLLEITPWPEAPVVPNSLFFSHQGKLGLSLHGGAIEVHRLQVEGAQALTARQFMAGYHEMIPTLP